MKKDIVGVTLVFAEATSPPKAYGNRDDYKDSHTAVSALQSRCAVGWRLGIRILNATFDTSSLGFGKLSSKEKIPKED